MQILIVVLLAIIAIAVAPWAVGIIALALGTYITAVTIVSVLAAALLVVVLSWRGVASVPTDLKPRKSSAMNGF